MVDGAAAGPVTLVTCGEEETSDNCGPHCKAIVVMTLRRRDVPVSEGKDRARNILVIVCDTCDRVSPFLPTQRLFSVRRVRAGSKPRTDVLLKDLHLWYLGDLRLPHHIRALKRVSSGKGVRCTTARSGSPTVFSLAKTCDLPLSSTCQRGSQGRMLNALPAQSITRLRTNGAKTTSALWTVPSATPRWITGTTLVTTAAGR